MLLMPMCGFALAGDVIVMVAPLRGARTGSEYKNMTIHSTCILDLVRKTQQTHFKGGTMYCFSILRSNRSS